MQSNAPKTFKWVKARTMQHLHDENGGTGISAPLITQRNVEEGFAPKIQARLDVIEAAPALLKSLKRWARLAKDNGFTDADYHDANTGWISEMNAAIAHAEGGQQCQGT